MNTNRWARLFTWQRMNKNEEEESKEQEPKEKKKEETTKLK